MKIGIITHHYVGNYGAVLQAEALLNIIKKIKLESYVEIVNYRIAKHNFLSNSRFFHFKKRDDNVNSFSQKIRLFFIFRKFQGNLPHSRSVKKVKNVLDNSYDYIIVGSDEVWNFMDQSFDNIKFGVNISNKIPMISYAASVGASTDLSKFPVRCKKFLTGFKGLSVRDELTSDFVKNICGREALLVLDPTFLYDFPTECNNKLKEIISRPYVLIYDCRLNQDQAELIKSFASKNNLLILGAGEYHRWYDFCTIDITPHEWTTMFKNADYIITGTFHGTAFSIKYNKKFISYVTENNRINKVKCLLGDFGLSERMIGIEQKNQLISRLVNDIDYKSVNEILNHKTEQSLSFLQDALR